MEVNFDWSVISDRMLTVFISAARSCAAPELESVLAGEAALRSAGAGRVHDTFTLRADDPFAFMKILWNIGQAVTNTWKTRDASDAGELIASTQFFTAIIASLTPPPSHGGGPRGMVN